MTKTEAKVRKPKDLHALFCGVSEDRTQGRTGSAGGLLALTDAVVGTVEDGLEVETTAAVGLVGAFLDREPGPLRGRLLRLRRLELVYEQTRRVRWLTDAVLAVRSRAAARARAKERASVLVSMRRHRGLGRSTGSVVEEADLEAGEGRLAFVLFLEPLTGTLGELLAELRVLLEESRVLGLRDREAQASGLRRNSPAGRRKASDLELVEESVHLGFLGSQLQIMVDVSRSNLCQSVDHSRERARLPAGS